MDHIGHSGHGRWGRASEKGDGGGWHTPYHWLTSPFRPLCPPIFLQHCLANFNDNSHRGAAQHTTIKYKAELQCKTVCLCCSCYVIFFFIKKVQHPTTPSITLQPTIHSPIEDCTSPFIWTKITTLSSAAEGVAQ